MKGTGLALEGGGMRGLYSAGVLDVLGENGFEFDAIIGVSAGAIHGSSYISGQHGRNIRYYEECCNDKRFFSWRNLLLNGDMVGIRFAYHDIPEKLYPYDFKKFLESKTKFYAVCTNMLSGKPEYHHITDMRNEIDTMRASASLPFCSKKVWLNGIPYMDGGCSDSIPAQALLRLGYEKNVVILTQDISYRKSPMAKWIPRLFYWRYPNFVNTLIHRHEMYNRQTEMVRHKEKTGELFVIRPSQKLTISRTSRDRNELETVYQIGRADARAILQRLKAYLDN